MQPTKYFLYARKSSEDEERQVKSIEDQISELIDLAAREGIRITKRFYESKSAKTPGREVFNDMIVQIYASKEPIGILSWHPDRLARNSVDGGQIIYLVDIEKVTALKFPTFWFEPTPQGLFMLQIAFGQYKYYSDNLSQNVKRGNRNIVKRGEWLGNCPIGYIRNHRTKNIDIDPIKAQVVKMAFETFATGKYSLCGLGEYLNMLGITNKTGKTIGISSMNCMLSSTAYIGLIRYNGEVFEGTFDPIISKELYEEVQRELHRRSRPRKRKHKIAFPFSNTFTCGECGYSITSQYAKGNGGTYIYYRCTKKNSTCSQRYLRDDRFLAQVKKGFTELALTDQWCAEKMDEAKKLEKNMKMEKQSFVNSFNTKTMSLEKKLDKRVEAFLDGTIEKSIYLEKKQALLTTKMNLQKKQKSFEQNQISLVGQLKDFISTCRQAQVLTDSIDTVQIKEFLVKNSTTRIMKNQKLSWNWIKPFDVLTKPELIWEWELILNSQC